jgi:cation:H+ antiporter
LSTGLAIAVFVGSFVLSVSSTLVFARELDRFSERLGASEGLHGILTALGADAPEISAAIAALVSSNASVGVGVVIGSNVFNLAALLGVSALIAGYVRIHRHGLLFNGGVALLVTVIAAALVLEAIGAPAATLLLALILVPYVFLLSIRPTRIKRLVPLVSVRRFIVAAVAEEIRDLRTEEQAPSASIGDVLALGPSLAGIVLASVGMVHAAIDLAGRFGISDVIVGTLVLAALTSIPNLLTAVRLALHGRGSAVVSESFNSNSLNVLAGIALPALVLSLGSATGIVTFTVWWLLGMTLIAVVLTYTGHGLRRLEGAFLILLYGVFVAVIASQ